MLKYPLKLSDVILPSGIDAEHSEIIFKFVSMINEAFYNGFILAMYGTDKITPAERIISMTLAAEISAHLSDNKAQF